MKKTDRIAAKFGWWLMSLPTGYSEPSMFLLKYGPYRWGAKLSDWSYRNGTS